MQKNRFYLIMSGIVLLAVLIFSCSKNEDMVLNGNLMQGKLLNPAITASSSLTPIEELGKALFFDTKLSDPSGNQSCATCHGPNVGFTGPNEVINMHGAVYEGAFSGRFGDRKPPSAAYGGNSPVLYQDGSGTWIGGMFWDGRATGWTLGDPLAEQAKGPYLNPKEQNIASAQALIDLVKASVYAGLFEQVFPGSLGGDVNEAYNNVGRAVAAYERSSEVSPFTSKYDYWLKGKAKLSAEEHLGRAMFQGKAKCAKCHTIKGKQPLFTDFTYDNLGIPKNPENPATIADPDWADPGLGGFLESIHDATAPQNIGKHKVPTLRNVDLRPSQDFVKAYGHNGYFKSLEEIVHFYNTRDVIAWPAPEVADNMNTTELGNLGLSPREEAAIVAFMKTLSDGYMN